MDYKAEMSEFRSVDPTTGDLVTVRPEATPDQLAARA
jgi:hypothetical protein